MNKKQLKDTIIARCPKIPQLRKAIARHELQRHIRLLMSETEIEKAESSPEEKQKLLAEAAEKWPNRNKIDNARIDKIFKLAPDYKKLSEEQKKKIRQDILFCRFAYGFMPEEYVCFNFPEKTREERLSYISESDHMRYCYQMNDPVDIGIFNDKMRTYEALGKYYRRSIVSVSGKNDYEQYREFVKKHPVFVKKQVHESCGNSIERIDLNNCGMSERELFESFLPQGKVILEELVEQGECTAVFNSSSVNTIRCITFNTAKDIAAPYCFMKIGRAGSFVDNGGAGGILVGLDHQTGVSNTFGIDEMRNIYEKHPDSGVDFVGHQMPEWDKMIAICKEMSAKFSTVKYIGWDMAYAKDKGWVVIEGNGMSQFIGPQTIWQKGIKEEVQQFMREM